MPRYYFHLYEGDDHYDDEDGQEFDADDVMSRAVAAARSLMGDALQRGELNYGGRLCVEDERGEAVCVLTFNAAVTITAEPPAVTSA